MDREMDGLGMLDLMIRPGFCVRDKKIIKCNAGAQALLFEPGMEIIPLLATGAEEYEAFSAGQLYLTLRSSGVQWSASVTRMAEGDIFLLEQEADCAELQSMALAARELRDPLSSVLTTAERLFPMTALDSDPIVKEQAARLNRGLYQILRVIGNMSDAGVYASTPTSQLETQDVTAILAEIFSRAGELAAQGGLNLNFENLPKALYCLIDREKLERAVLNILSNAMKFTVSGGRIDAKLTRRGNRLYLTVQDSGEGIAENLRGSIHSRYRRQPGIEDGRFGIGLGMVLIRSVAAIHGGTVLIDHPEGVGTRITMTLAIRQDSSGSIRSPLLCIDYAGERDHSLIELSDVLPADVYHPEVSQ